VIQLMLPSHCFIGTIARCKFVVDGFGDVTQAVRESKFVYKLKKRKIIILFNLKTIFTLLIRSNKYF
jgi:hypothetical protein